MSSPDPVLIQLKRIKGQLDGIISMYEDEKSCIDVVHQVIAARNSLGSVAQKLLFGEANKCTQERRVEDLNEILREVFRY
jgi:DNA-binding FrmR family transcriptional regulator